MIPRVKRRLLASRQPIRSNSSDNAYQTNYQSQENAQSPSARFGWIDQRLLRDGYHRHFSPQALALYVLLLCASDAQGLSYYSAPRRVITESCDEEIKIGAHPFQ
jgi:hypothetical protein